MTRANGVRILTDRVCRNKRQHETLASAEKHRVELLWLGANNVSVYPCHVCGFFHVGHDRLGQSAQAVARDLWAEATKDVRRYAAVKERAA